jgi:asparagine synthase (glutamine-hydrolysing)
MCGIDGILELNSKPIKNINHSISVMNELLKHRGPDSNGKWTNEYVGLGHTRLSILDLSSSGSQPMIKENLILTFNGEIYNYIDIKKMLHDKYDFITTCDTEVILALYSLYKKDCVQFLDGMFSFAIWDNDTKELFCARDRIGIKPFYYLIQNDVFYFASEVKALIPFINTDELKIDKQGITEYLMFQYPITENTLIQNIKQLMPAHTISIKNGDIKINRYWSVDYNNKLNCSNDEHIQNIEKLFDYSIDIHLNSDVPIASYVSGGVDSSIVSILSSNKNKLDKLFHGKFSEYPKCDESKYAEIVAEKIEVPLICRDITCSDFRENINKIIYHMDYPAAGPGVFPQFMISEAVSKSNKVVLGGQGGDEIFGGYARYIIPYFEKCISDSIDGNSDLLINLLPAISVLKEYKPMLKEFLQDGTFDTLDKRYFRLCDRSTSIKDIINWDKLNQMETTEIFINKFNNQNIPKNDYFNKMLHFDLENSLPALLHVEDRVSMAWGLESRVPLLNHKLIEYVSSIPENVKINPGNMKFLLKETYKNELPDEILNRKDKMGFPVPLNDWIKNVELNQYFKDLMKNLKGRNLEYLNISDNIINSLDNGSSFSRQYWILMNIELWYQTFFDKFKDFRDLLHITDKK